MLRWVLGALVLLVLAGVGVVGYWWFFTGSAAEEVSLDSAIAAIGETTDDTGAVPATSAPAASSPTTSAPTTSAPAARAPTSTLPAVAPTNTPAPSSTAAAAAPTSTPAAQVPDNLTGIWQLATDGPQSFAGYRLQEVLAIIGDKTVVGRTPDVSATLEFANVTDADGTNGAATQGQLVRAEVAVRTATLATESSHRDGHARASLDVANYPEATFTLTAPVVLVPDGGLAAAPATWSGDVTGELTIKGVTRTTTFDIDAQLADDFLVVVGSAPITFADFGVELPTAASVLSIEEHGMMEFQLYLRRTAPMS